MKRLASYALQGLVAVLPVALTVYLIYWLLLSMEAVASLAIRAVLPDDDWYFQGLGLLSALLVLILVGMLVDGYVVQHLLRLGDSLMSRIPLVKSVYGAIQDVLRALSITRDKSADSVVMVEVQPGMQLIGFITGRNIAPRLMPTGGEEIIGVYLPMSYQLGGYTVYVPVSSVQHVDISVEEAMRIAVTGASSTAEQAVVL
ncbi:DUF502 domain-containing protein [Kineobactrum salinum]|uniref:DUF502 domain-containing protein n=1 Tax=Kineobactrum salinum TaxID=2708301 RepID=A0A6C0TXY9_9GAMM|nr:DUF502 domain-containing protein [Kineobactrum salinum]QIB64661.1 DUF502 domain-containing protein [Kineobactrum salinum]